MLQLNRKAVWLLASALTLTTANFAFAEAPAFEQDWRFSRGDVAGAEQANFDDAAWTKVDVPHDWAINGQFDKAAPATGSGGWLPTGIAWYRKHFTATPAAHTFIELDGVMNRSGVWVNGHHVGYRPNGYSSLRYEITDFLKEGENVIAVRADTSFQPASRWYAGGGVYRHVRLISKPDTYADFDSTIITTPKITPQAADVRIATEVVNTSKTDAAVYAEVRIFGDKGGPAITTFKSEPQTLTAGGRGKFTLTGSLPKPKLWDLESPNLYTAMIDIHDKDGRVIDVHNVTFGVREMRFEAATGFWLNGKNIKLKGVAIHADGGAFGMAVPLSFYERRLKGLKALGVNAIRTAHHPFGPEFLDLCDKLGLVVMDEAFDMWTVAKSPKDYSLFFTDWSSQDAREFVKRDRNHPSIAIWSIGNEIHDTAYPVVAKSIIARLKPIFNTEDSTRPVTMALFRPNTTGDYENGLADMLDVVGQNYRENELAKAHADKPTRMIIGTENSKNRGSWVIVRDDAAYAGMFLWTGADYLGEADRAGWPYISNPSGLVDRTDVVKPIGWERASWWSEKPVVKIGRRVTEVIDTSELPTMVGVAMPQPKGPGVLDDWTPADLKPHPEKVEIVSNAPEVEVFLNGKSLGRKPRNKDDSARLWTVDFTPGEIRAVAYDGKKKLAEDKLTTAGPAVSLKLIAEQTSLKPGFDNIGFIRAEVVDAKGVRVPDAIMPLSVSVEGAGKLAAFDNGNPMDTTSFSATTRTAFKGRALVMVRASEAKGKITVTLKAEGLKPATATIDASGNQ
jgi:beta-galactosidase